MALTADQQFQMDLEAARSAAQLELETKRAAAQLELEVKRSADMAAMQAKQAKLDAVRLAKETLIENRRNMPVDQREVSAADITAFAQSLVSYIDA